MTAHSRIVDVPRWRDDEVLEWIRLHEEGRSWGSIARQYGKPNAAAIRNPVLAVLNEPEPAPVPAPHQNHRHEKPRSDARCGVCGRRLTRNNRTGVCRAHNHAQPHCQCVQCKEIRQ